MKKAITTVCFLLLLIPIASGQNLVPNGNFEQYSGCPMTHSAISNCTGWNAYTLPSTDYFNACVTNTNAMGVPDNMVGYQAAASGNGYAGLYTYFHNAPSFAREYLHRQITPMQPGKWYEVSLSASLADTSGYGSDNIGVYFYDRGITPQNPVYFVNWVPAVPQVSYSNSGIVTDTINWKRLTAYYSPDSAYDNIVIGGFYPDIDVNFIQLNNKGYKAYYYIDSVVVREVLYHTKITSVDSVFCLLDTITVQFNAVNFSSGNKFILQLSDSSGSFVNSTLLDSVVTNVSGSIKTVFPSSVIPGQNYRVRLIATNPSFVSPDNGFRIKLLSPANAQLAQNNGPVCTGSSVNFTAITIPGATYAWTGPNLFSSAQQNPTRANAQTSDGGMYIITATTISGCKLVDTTVVSIITPPSVYATVSPGTAVCEGWAITLTATPANAGINPTFEWFRNGVTTNATGIIYNTLAQNPGDSYTVKVTATGTGCTTPIASAPVVMNITPAMPPPSITIAANPGIHVWPYVEVVFTATTATAGAHPGYSWRKNGKDLPGANDSVLKLTNLKTGDTICCVVTSNFLCAAPREVMSNCLVMDVDLSVDNYHRTPGEIKFYPNPNKGNFILTTGKAGTLQISNIQGQFISQYSIQPGENSIALPQGIPNGIYIGRILHTDGAVNVIRIEYNK
jgi:hypothetical protein